MQARLHTLYQGDNDTPDSASDDYAVRRQLFNDAILEWEESGNWRELYSTLTAASDGDKTATSGVTAYDCPTDCNRILGYVRITESNGTINYYKQLDITEEQLRDNDTETLFFYITGNPSSGYQINLNNPKAGTIRYEYYKHAAILDATTDKPEMRDPYFAIYHALSILLENDGLGDRATLAKFEKDKRLSAMQLHNAQLGAYQDMSIPDYEYDQGVGGFGL